jgi:hypothetical protein
MKKKRRLSIRIMAHLSGVFGIVAADAEDAAHWKAQVAPSHRQRRPRADINDVGGFA